MTVATRSKKQYIDDSDMCNICGDGEPNYTCRVTVIEHSGDFVSICKDCLMMLTTKMVFGKEVQMK